MVATRDECKAGGLQLGYPFNKEVADADGRPAGCFWDVSVYSYFNKILDASATYLRVGGICKPLGKLYLFKCCEDLTYLQ